MIEINNKAYRNLQEQVKKNMDDIEMLKKRLGYQGPYDSTSEITHPEDKAIYIIGDDAPYHLYQYDGISQTYLDLGPLNIKGDTGETGAQGPQGERGIRGEQGPEGPQGPQGEQGPQGIQGIQGVQGIQGPAGQDGLTTDIYVNGQTYTQVEGTITLPDYPTSLTWDDIEDKPTFATVATTGSYDDLSDKPDLSDVVTTDQLSTVAFSGDYDDLTDKPNLTNYVTTNTAQNITAKKDFTTGNGKTEVSGAGIKITDDTTTPSSQIRTTLDNNGILHEITDSSLALNEFAITTDYLDNVNTYVFSKSKTGTVAVTSDIPTKTSDLTNDSGYITGVAWNDVTDKPTFATVATSGSYDDLTNKPTIPTVPTNVSAFTNDAGYITGIDSSDVITALGYTPGTSNFDGAYNSLTGKPDLSVYAETSDLATVATTGSYNDLTNKPTIPDVSHMVTNNTAQTITGVKTFSNSGNYPIIVTGSYGINCNYNNNQSYLTPSQLVVNGGYNNHRKIMIDSDNITFNNTSNGYSAHIQSPAANLSADVTYALPTTSGTVALTSDIITSYDDLTDKPTIPDAVSGTNDGTNWTSLTIGSDTYGLASGSTPSNMVTTDTFQYITAQKSFGSISGNPVIVSSANGLRCEYLTNRSYLKPAQLQFYNSTTGYTATINSPASRLSENVTYILPTESGTVALTSDIITSYNDLTDKPTIPTDVVVIELAENTSGTLSASELTQVTTNPTKTLLYRGTVYYTLTGIGTTNIRFTSSNGFTSSAVWYTVLVNKTNGNWTYEAKTQNYISMNDFATVATTGDYDDLLNKPTIPTVPANVSAFNNDAGYITNSALTTYASLDDIYYKDGNTFAFNTYANLSGFLTSGGKAIQVSVTTPKSLANISSITVDNLYTVVRGIAGYVNGSSYIDYANTTGYTVTAYKATDNMITIVIDATNAYSSGTNNTPISLAFNPNNNNALKLTFNT